MGKKYIELAKAIAAKANCIKSGNEEWFDKWDDKINSIISSLPHGSGIDGRTELDDKSTGDKIIINSEYHCMNEGGYYDGWINFRLTITGSLMFGFNLNITGNFGKYQDVKDYLHEIFSYDLALDI